MARGMKIIAVLSVLLTAVFLVIYQFAPFEALVSIIITTATIAYHFWMRLFVGGAFNLALHNKVNYNKKWFKIGKTEQKIYKILKVKKWKRFFPTYDPNAFDKSKHSWSEIAQAMCQAELVHETIAVLSFVPILFSTWLGTPLVFILTSVFSALFDLIFVVIQRYNRPRVLKLVNTDAS